MRWVCVAVALAMAGPVEASTYEVSLPGTILTQINPGSDPNISVGDAITMTVAFDSANLYPWKDGSFITGSHGGDEGPLLLPENGPNFFRMTLNGLTWVATDHWLSGDGEFDDGDGPFPEGALSGIAFILKDGKLTLFAPHQLYSASVFPARPTFSDTAGGAFQITYNLENPDDYMTPGFTGQWDYAAATVRIDGILQSANPVPEPATWAMMLIGFGAIGAVKRSASHRRRASPAAS